MPSTDDISKKGKIKMTDKADAVRTRNAFLAILALMLVMTHGLISVTGSSQSEIRASLHAPKVEK
jgi:hypothetical protein